MANPVEFGKFYKLLQAVKDGSQEKNKELDWILAEYEHANESTSSYDELGQIFCHHGVMELYEYTGIDNINIISRLDKSVWDYLTLRMGVGLPQYMVKSMISHAKQHELAKKVSDKWNDSIEDIEANMEGLATYVADGIVELLD